MRKALPPPWRESRGRGHSAAIFFQVLQVGDAVKFGGAEKRMLRTLNCLAAEGVPITVVILSRLDRVMLEESLARMLERPISLHIVVAKSQWVVFRVVLRMKYGTILYTDSYRAMLPFLLGGILTRSRRVMLHVTTFLAPGRFHSPQQAALFWLVRRLSTHIDVLYPEAMERTRRGNPRAQVTMTPTPTGSSAAQHASQKERTILFLGSLAAIKGPDLLVEAAARIADELRSAGYRLQIAGSGPLGPLLAELIIEKGIEDLVDLPGQVDPADVLGSASIFTSLQVHNNYPSQSLIEALAAGCFIVATDEGDTRLLVNADFGILVRRDPGAIAEGLLHAIGISDDDRRRSAHAARRFFAALQAKDRSAEHYLGLIGHQ